MPVTRDNQRPLVIVPMAALGGGQDDWPSVIGQANAVRGTGAVQLLPSNGVFLCKSVVPLEPGAILIGRPEVNIVSSLANGTGFANSVLKAGVQPSGGGSTLSAAFNAVGSRVLSVNDTTDLSPGTSIGVGSGTRAMYYRVVSRSVASGAGTVTVERPILWKFAINETVDVVNPNERIFLYGNGATISGTGDRAIELTALHFGVVDDWHIDASAGFGAIVCNLDVGSYRSRWSRIRVVGGYGAQAGIGIESAESCHMVECSVDNVATLNVGFSPGIHVPDCRDCHVTRCTSTRNELGFTWNTNGGTPEDGSFWCSLSDSMVTESNSHGVMVQSGSGRNRVARVMSNYNLGHGLFVTNAAPWMAIGACDLSHNAGDGFQSSADTFCFLESCNAEGNATNGYVFIGDGVGVGLRFAENGVVPALAGTNAGVQIQGAASVQLFAARGAPLVAAALGIGVFSSSTGRATCVGCDVDMTGTLGGTKVGYELEAAGTFDLSSSRANGGNFGYAQQTAGAKFRRGVNCDLASAIVPVLIAAGTANQVDVVSGGAGAVQVIACACSADDAIECTLLAAGGAVTTAPIIVPAAGTFNFTAPATRRRIAVRWSREREDPRRLGAVARGPAQGAAAARAEASAVDRRSRPRTSRRSARSGAAAKVHLDQRKAPARSGKRRAREARRHRAWPARTTPLRKGS